jgi:hypothetical protein
MVGKYVKLIDYYEAFYFEGILLDQSVGPSGRLKLLAFKQARTPNSGWRFSPNKVEVVSMPTERYSVEYIRELTLTEKTLYGMGHG